MPSLGISGGITNLNDFTISGRPGHSNHQACICCRRMEVHMGDGTGWRWTQTQCCQHLGAGLPPVQQRRAFWCMEATRPATRGTATCTCWICTRISGPAFERKARRRSLHCVGMPANVDQMVKSDPNVDPGALECCDAVTYALCLEGSVELCSGGQFQMQSTCSHCILNHQDAFWQLCRL